MAPIKARAIPSMPEMAYCLQGDSPDQTQLVTLKVLYMIDNKTTFLARSSLPITARTANIHIQGSEESIKVGAVPLNMCLRLVMETSPELFSGQDLDYSLYSKDVSEPGEPFVGHGLYSKVQNNGNVLVSGLVCQSFMGIFNQGESSSVSDTLEVRLRLSRMFRVKNDDEQAQSGQNIELDDQEYFQRFRKRKSVSKASNSKEYPVKATRTQSMPQTFIGLGNINTIPQRIKLAELEKSSQELSTIDESIEQRFQGTKLLSMSTKKRNKKILPKAANSPSVGVSQCINCKSTDSSQWKYHKSGIFEFGNSGMLCLDCNEMQLSNDIKGLRERGRLANQGFLDAPYKNSKKQALAGRFKAGVDDPSSEGNSSVISYNEQVSSPTTSFLISSGSKKLPLFPQPKGKSLSKPKGKKGTNSPGYSSSPTVTNIKDKTTNDSRIDNNGNQPLQHNNYHPNNTKLNPPVASNSIATTFNVLEDYDLLHFNTAPLTDLDPLPSMAYTNKNDDENDKENLPPSDENNELQGLLDNHELDKMFTAFSGNQRPGETPNFLFSGSPSQWIELASPGKETKGDEATPVDVETCQTLECNDDDSSYNNKKESKISTMPSSPFMASGRDGT
ncbi:hypothetical protein LJB42_001964 [Komagataella kurtzmanii]|nr:hypothetical protein LJB42_001964 [Komagataella kurtzmanii]